MRPEIIKSRGVRDGATATSGAFYDKGGLRRAAVGFVEPTADHTRCKEKRGGGGYSKVENTRKETERPPSAQKGGGGWGAGWYVKPDGERGGCEPSWYTKQTVRGRILPSYAKAVKEVKAGGGDRKRRVH